jgi:uncharacterized protein
MDRKELVLAALSTSNGLPWSPVQVQKLFFILDQRAAANLGGPHWDFKPYDYGPFDASVYSELEILSYGGLASIAKPSSGPKEFRLQPEGQRRGEALLASLPEGVVAYVRDLAKWVRSLTFQQLVSAVYREFPEMKANSVFRE